MKHKEIKIKPAVGGFILEYNDYIYGNISEVVPTEAKLIKRIRDLLDYQSRVDKAHADELEKASEALKNIQLNE